MIKVLLLTRYDRLGASSRLRFLQYIPQLATRGIEVKPAPFFDDLYLSQRYQGKTARMEQVALYYMRRVRDMMKAGSYDLIWLEKEALPWIPAVLECAWLQHYPYVLDIDDAWFHRYQSHHSSLIRTLLGGKLERLAQNAAAVIVGNEFLESWARDAGASYVAQLPSSVDLKQCPHPLPRQQNGTFTIGWIGQPSTVPYLQRIAEVLRKVCNDSRTSLRLIGAGPIELPGVALEQRPWVEQHEFDELSSVDVGIAPLDDGIWERGKTSFKIVQYMAAALPVVASRVRAHRTIIEDGRTGFLVDTDEEWVRALSRLRRDRPLRSRMGQAGRGRVEERYTLQANVDSLAEIIGEAYERTSPALLELQAP